MKLNLGSSDRHIPGYLSVDIKPDPKYPGQVIANLEHEWPWPDSSVSEVLAYDILEHLRDKIHTLNELWRVLEPGGLATITVPHATDGDGGHCDPTHVSYWVPSSFDYVEVGNENWTRFREPYGIRCGFHVLKFDTRHVKRRRSYTVELAVTLEAVKPGLP